jgi:DNA (cytosine-5)-methyltransferase 1
MFQDIRDTQDGDHPVPVVDLFAGPGGLSEGFASYRRSNGDPYFGICLAIEKEHFAHLTLELRSFFRQFPQGEAPGAYYDFLRDADRPLAERRQQLFNRYPEEATAAAATTWMAELGEEQPEHIHERIVKVLGSTRIWVLLGGPPCQAYSVVGRARSRGLPGYIPEEDKRQYLYIEYLQVIAEHEPAVFIMENVKGLLSATLRNQLIFERIVDDLKAPSVALRRDGRRLSRRHGTSGKARYRIYSVARQSLFDNGDLRDFVVTMEQHGIPQARHRLILLGVREDLGQIRPDILPISAPVSADSVLRGLPRLRAGLSREQDISVVWQSRLNAALDSNWFDPGLSENHDKVRGQIVLALNNLSAPRHDRGAEFIACEPKTDYVPEWFLDPRLEGICNHRARAHIVDDLHRYLYAACFAKAYGRSPRLKDFPAALLPEHRNVNLALNGEMFADRFRVQLANRPATTIASHIARDGHYYIHYDPTQCRSLTVREAARLQTFPDNYFFCGPRTSQYVQVGNAVPPLLAHQIAGIVFELVKKVGAVN